MVIQRIIILVNLILIAIGAYFGAGLFYQIVMARSHAEQISPAALASPPSQGQPRQRPIAVYNPILQRDLFKTQKTPVQGTASTSQVNVDEMEQTSLKLKLWGTVAGLEKQSYAVIEDTQKREQNLYRVGDTIQRATVKAILRSKVVLNVNGKDEVLAMEQLLSGAAPRSSQARRRPSPSSGQVRTQRISLRRSMINDAIQDVSKLMTQIQIVPQDEGLAISNIKPNSIFRRMGLRNGDILKSVDGQEIRSVDDALKLYESLKSADSVGVSIQRRGRDRNINYMIR